MIPGSGVAHGAGFPNRIKALDAIMEFSREGEGEWAGAGAACPQRSQTLRANVPEDNLWP